MTITAIILITLLVTGALCLVAKANEKAKEMQAFTYVDGLFREMWDGSTTNELHTWMKLRKQLKDANQPAIYIVAADKHIAIVRSRHKAFRTVALRNGRTIIVSTQN